MSVSKFARILTAQGLAGLNWACHPYKNNKNRLSLHVIQEFENEEDEKLLHHCAY
jgi:hypothetical protein